MARPRKQTVDYFPHDCNPSRSLKIIQMQYGNDGYAFWFKLLQLLGKTEGHVLDYNNAHNWLYLLAETHIADDKALQILETLASVGSIDKELYEQKIIWSQHFVDNVADVYKRRRVQLPTRPGSPPSPIPEQTETEHTTIDTDDIKIASMITYYEENVGKPLTPHDLELLKDFADTYDDGLFEKAVDEAVAHKARSPMSYIQRVLEHWQEADNPESKDTGIKTDGYKVE